MIRALSRRLRRVADAIVSVTVVSVILTARDK